MSDIVSLVRKFSKKNPEKLAYLFLENGTDESGSLSYRQLDENARAIAVRLQDKGLVGERVLLIYSPGLDFISAFIGCLYAGVVAIPMAILSSHEFEKNKKWIQSVKDDAKITGILTSNKWIQNIAEITSQTTSEKIELINTSTLDTDTCVMYQKKYIDPNSIAYLQYTSGSTANPKAAIITHRNLFHNVKQSAKAWCYKSTSITLSWAPHSHVYGLICGLLVPLYRGSTTILIPATKVIQNPLCWLSAISKYKVTHSGAPNFAYDLCVNEIKEQQIENLDLTSWQVAVNGGETIKVSTLRNFMDRYSAFGFSEKSFCSGFGMSELSGTIALSPYQKKLNTLKLNRDALKENKLIFEEKVDDTRIVIGSGKIIKGLKVKIVDPETFREVGKNSIGEIWIRGKSLANGYWKSEKVSSDSFHAKILNYGKSYFRTGDLGFIHKKELFITGRLKEVIIQHGKKYYPSDLEISISEKIKTFGIYTKQIIVNKLIDNNEEIIILQEIPDNLSEMTKDEIISAIRTTISEIHGLDVHKIIFLKENSLPKTASGKLQRKLAIDQFENNQLPIIKINEKKLMFQKQLLPLVPKTTNYLLFKKECIALIAATLKINPSEIDLTKRISTFGFDSISITRLTADLNTQFKLSLTPAVLFDYTNLETFIRDIYSKLSAFLVSQKITSTDNDPQVNQIIKNIDSNDIAIIGMSGQFPQADDLDTFWHNQIKEQDAITEIPSSRWDWQEYNSIKWGGFLNDVRQFDAAFFNISPREAELTDPQQRLFLQTVWKAIEDAGYATETLAKIPTGLFVGVFNNDYAELLQKNEITDAYVTTGITHSILANRISFLLNLHGPSEAIDTACSSSLVAIHNAVRAIQDGDCEMAIAGGVNLLLSPTPFLDANKAGMLSEEGRCKTFDKSANGYVRSEGVAAIILKSLSKAIADGDHIYGVIKGSAVNHGGHANSLTAPNSIAQSEVIMAAMNRAQVAANSISYIETHGTGTALGDPIEVNGLLKAFSTLEPNLSNKYFCALGSVKTHIGHLEAAAGMAGIIKVLLAMKHHLLPINLHLSEKNPYIKLENSPFYLVEETEPWQRLKSETGEEIPRRAGISSFGFGGTNAHIVLEEAPDLIETFEVPNTFPYAVALSGRTKEALDQRIHELYTWITKQKYHPSLAAVSYTLNAGRNHFEKRCIFIVETVAELISSLNQIIEKKEIPHNCLVNFNRSDKERIRFIFDGVYNDLCQQITHHNIPAEEYKNKLFILANFYVEGFDLNWENLHRGAKKRLALPTYPFAKTHFWIPDKNAEVFKENELIPYNDKQNVVETNFLDDIAEILKISKEKISEMDSLSDLGFDSISFKEFAVKLENRYKKEFNPSLFFTYNTVGALRRYLADSKVIESNLISISESHSQSKIIHKSNDEIAIIGIQGYFPQSKDVETFWQHLVNSDDLITEVPRERWDWKEINSVSKWGGFIPDFDKFDAAFFNISAREANMMDPQQRLFMEIVWKTIEDAGYDPLSFSGKNIGVFAGIEFNEYQTLIQTSHKTLHGHVATGTSHALIANRISYFLNLHGPSEVIDTACSSSLIAIHRAIQSIKQNECEMAIAGGISLMMNPDTFVITSQLGALSADGACKTFDKSANGYVKGEGVAAILLKSLNSAKRDGDYIYGVVKGSAINHGGKAQSLTAPNAAAQTQLIVSAYQQANVDPETVSYIETHGTGTELGDPVEIEGLKQAFAELTRNKSSRKQNYCGMGSVKTNIGHLEPASGIASVIKVLQSMKHQKLPGLLHFKELNPFINLSNSPFYIVDKTQSWKRIIDGSGNEIPLRAGISSFGMGGSYAHLIVEEYRNSNTHREHPYYLITLSAKQEISLNQKVQDLYDWLQTKMGVDLTSLSFTLNTGRGHFQYRYALVVKSLEELTENLKAIIGGNLPVNCYKTLKSDEFKQADNLSSLSAKEKLIQLAERYVRGNSINWSDIYTQATKMSGLPTYPFNKQRFWFDSEIISTVEPILEASPDNLNHFAQEYLKQIFAKKLQINSSQISIDETYEVYGVDSLIGLEITNELESQLGTIPKTILYEKNRIRDLAEFCCKHYSDKLIQLSGKTYQKPISNSIKKIDHAKTRTEDEIAIVGLDLTFPQSKDVNEFWNNLVNSKNSITEIPKDRWDYNDYPINVGGEEKFFKFGGFIADVDKFDPLFFGIAPREAALMDPQERLFMQSVWGALEDAGYTRELIEKTVGNNVGVFAGVTYNFYPLFIAEEWSKGNQLPLDIQMFSVANRISYFMNFKGPSYVVDTACSSSLAAIHLACESLRRNECKMAIAGGVNLSLHPSKYHFLGGYGFLSEKGQCASFAEGGSGYVPGEGVASLVLKPLAAAIRDNDRIYGVIKGSSMNHGGKTSGYTVPNPNAQAELIKEALQKANVDARTISYIEAHGTGTALGDPIEVRGLQEAFEEYTNEKQFCAIGSVKSNIGHLESAAGVSQLIKVLFQFKYKKLVPSLHAEKLNTFIDFSQTPFYVQRTLADWNPPTDIPRRAGVSSFGAGGTNIHVVLEEFATKTSQVIIKPFIFILSATNQERLLEHAKQMLSYLEQEAMTHEQHINEWLTQVCYTLQTGRETFSQKLAIIAEDYQALVNKLSSILKTPTTIPKNTWMSPQTAIVKSSEDNLEDLFAQQQYAKLAELWVTGIKINWKQLYKNELPVKTSLPHYPFAKRHCWVGDKHGPQETPTITAPTLEPKETPMITKPIIMSGKETVDSKGLDPASSQVWFYTTKWETLENIKMNESIDTYKKLIFSDVELGLAIQNYVDKAKCTYCFAGTEFKKQDKSYYINPNNLDDYHQLFSEVQDCNEIIYLWSLEYPAESLINLYKALSVSTLKSQIKIMVVTRDGNKIKNPINAFSKIFSLEMPNVTIKSLMLPKSKNLQQQAKCITEELADFNVDELDINYQENQRSGLRLIPQSFNASHSLDWTAPETVLITGGLGSIAKEVAKWLVDKGCKYLLLIGRSLPPSSKDNNQQKYINLRDIEDLGINVKYISANVCDKSAMQTAIEETEHEWKKPIRGVFHLACEKSENIKIADLTPDYMQKILAPKIQGSLVLHDLFKNNDLNCFVLFSSLSGVPYFGLNGLSIEAMGSEFQNELALHRHDNKLPATVIHWSSWDAIGVSADTNHADFLSAVGLTAIKPNKGMQLLNDLLTITSVSSAVVNINWHKFLQVNPEAKKNNYFNLVIHKEEAATPNKIAITQALEPDKVKDRLFNLLANALQLSTAEIDPDAPYQNYGMDSIIGINFVSQIGEHYPEIVSPMDLYRYPTLNQLINFILESSQPQDKEPVTTEFQSEPSTETLDLKNYENMSEEEVAKLLEAELKELDQIL